MPGISSSGIGSGLDVNGLVSQLVAAERGPQDARLARLDTQLTTEFTALSQLKGAMGGFQSAITGLKDVSSLVARRATVSSDVRFAASAASTAAPGVYAVEVEQLAKAAQLTSAVIAGGPTQEVGTGTLTLSIGGSAFSVVIDDTNKTLSGVRDAINKATNNTGVYATVLTGIGGSHLVLTGGKTGAANAVTVAQSGGNGGLAQFAYAPPTPSSMTAVDAQDAIVNISNVEVHSATNTINGAIDGITLTLKAEAPGTTDTLTVVNDEAAVLGKIGGFVTSYNALATQIAKLRSYDPATKKAGPLIGDSLLLNIESQLRRTISNPVAGTADPYTSLANIGITFGTDGSLALNATKFQAAMTANSTAVTALFSSTSGVATTLAGFLDNQLATNGNLAARTTGIDAQRKILVSRQEALNTRMVTVQARYLKQFTALDGLLSRMQSTSNYLTQQLSQSTSIAKSAGT